MLKFIKPYIAKYRNQLIVYVLVGMVFFSLSLAQPFIFGIFVDHLVVDFRKETILQCCAVFLVVTVLQIILSYYVKITGTQLNCCVSTHVKAQFFQHFQKTSPRFHLQKSATAMANKINNDVEYLIMFFLNMAMQLPGKIVCFLFATLYIFYVDYWCGIAVLLMLPLLAWLYIIFKDRIFKTSHTNAEARNQFFVSLHEQFNSVRSIRINQLNDILSRRFYQCGKTLEKAAVNQEKVSFPYTMVDENMDVFLKIFLFSYGGLSVLKGGMTVGEFTILYFYMSLITSSFSYILNIGHEIQENMVFYTRLKELSDVPEEQNGIDMPEKIRKVSVNDLHFSYDEKEILNGISYDFYRDKIYCFVGKNGAGKSTLMNLLLGLYVSDTGSKIYYNDTPIINIDLYKMRATQIGVSEQEPVMLSGSVGFNATYQDSSVYDKERLQELFKIVKFCDEESDFRNMEEILALDAMSLSGGQKQKVSLIKALYKNPQILLLDEPTSALDADSRHQFARYLRNNASGRITIIISHDQELIDLSDEVIHIGE